MVEENVVDKIKKQGYWRINIRPLEFKKDKIDSLGRLKEIISDCQVMYRGWSYPHIDEIISGDNYVWSGVDWQNHIEYWRFYQSLQFLHFFSMREDWENRVKHIFGGKIENAREPCTGLSVFNSLYTFAEIFEFVLRLIKKAPFESDIEFKIDLVGTKDRKLFLYRPHRVLLLSDKYISKMPEILYSKKYPIEEFLSNSPELACDCCFYFFERFNWDKIPKDFLRDELYKYIRRRTPEKIKKSKKED